MPVQNRRRNVRMTRKRGGNNESLLHIHNNTMGYDVSKIVKPKVATNLTIDSFHKDPNKRNIFMQIEPNVIHNHEAEIIKQCENYDFIITYNDEVLKKCKNAYKCVYGTSWIKPEHYDHINIKNKVFRITTVVGSKSGTAGYKLRRNSYDSQNLITSVPTRFFISAHSNNIQPRKNKNTPKLNKNSKDNLFKDSQFCLVIENSRQTNYFTEKLCDCIITKTIPVYWGCPNISEYFDTKGWIILEDESMEHLSKKVNALTPEYYMKHIDTVEKNYTKVKEYIDKYENLNRALRGIPGY